MKQWSTPQLLGTPSGPEDKIPVAIEFSYLEHDFTVPEGES